MVATSNSTDFEKIIVEHILDSGLSWKDITFGTGITKEEMSCSNARITPEQHYKLLNMLQSSSSLDWITIDNNFSINYILNKNNVLKSFSESAPTYAALILNCKDLRTALRHYVKYRAIVGNINELNLVEEKNKITFTYIQYYSEFYYGFVSIINFIFIIFIVLNYNNSSNLKFKITSCSEKNNKLEGICHYWGSEIIWNQKVDSISFESKNLDSTFEKFNINVYEILLDCVISQHDDIQEKSNIKDIVSSIILSELQVSDTPYSTEESLNKICDLLHVSKTKLSRQLKEQSTSFKSIEKNVKLDESIKLLQTTNQSIADISYQLGFSTQSVFNRFFNDLMKTTPLKYRKNTSSR